MTDARRASESPNVDDVFVPAGDMGAIPIHLLRSSATEMGLSGLTDTARRFKHR